MRHTHCYLIILLMISSSVVAQTTDLEKRADSVSRTMINLLNNSQPDSAYLLFSDAFKMKMSAADWKNFYQTKLVPLLPMKDVTFAGTQQGVHISKVNALLPLNVLVQLDAQNKVDFIHFQPAPAMSAAPAKSAVPADNPLRSTVDSLVDAAVKPYILEGDNVGLSVGVYYKGKDYYYNYGTTRAGKDSLADNHTIYEIGSISKTFTSTLLAIAVLQKKVKLDQPLTDFLQGAAAKNPQLKSITLKHLANHTAGFPKLVAALLGSDPQQPYAATDRQRLFAWLDTCTVYSKPGEKFEYSNIGAGLLGTILEQVYNLSYDALVQKYIAGPTGLQQTGVTAKGYTAQGYDHLKPVPAWEFVSLKGAGAIKSDSYDILQYAKRQWRKGNDTLQLAFNLTHQITFTDATNKMGLAWFHGIKTNDVLFHNGGTAGCRSFLIVNTKTETAVVVLSNTSDWVDDASAKIFLGLK